MKFFNKETSQIVKPFRELSVTEMQAVSGGEKSVCTTTSKTTVKGNTSTTVSTTVCTFK